MRSILNLSYMHLPPHLRACFLYLGMYPEDHTILRDDLVRQWVAEGFVSDLHGSDLEDVGKNYFNELINRSMVQPETVKYGEVLSCKVHDMILDLIRSKCAKNNFSCMANTYEDIAALHGCEHKVRRLSLKLSSGGATSRTIATNLSQVRSFARFAESSYTPSPSNYTPSILLFKYLQVLFFEYRYSSDLMVDLTYIDQLFQLRYLKVVCSGSIELPTEIQRLVHLETLKIDCQFLKGIPSDIALLPRLFHLTLPNGIPLPKGIRNIKSLRSLRCCQMDESSVEDIKGLGELTNLRDLTLHGWNISAAKIGALVSSIEKLCNLKYLLLSDRNDEFDQLVSLSKPPLFIEELNLQGWWLQNKIPKWIGDLRCLSILYLFVENLLTEEVHVIGKLPSLVHLDLVVRRNPEDRAAIICTGSFPVLECLELMCYDDVTACMGFEAGAMPKLRRLDLSIWDKWGGATPVGMEHLLALQQIRICMHPPSEHAGRDAESVFRNAAQVHPTRPSVTMG